MINSELQTLVHDLIVTKDDRALLLDAISMLKESAYTTDTSKLVATIKKTVPVAFFRPLEILLTNSQSAATLTASVKDLEDYLNSLEIIHVSLCYEPTRRQVEELSNKLKTLIAKPTIIEHSVAQDSLGVQIDYNGTTYKKNIEIKH